MDNENIEDIKKRLQLDYIAVYSIGACFFSVGVIQLLNYYNVITFRLFEIYIVIIIGIVLQLIYGWIIYIKNDA